MNRVHPVDYSAETQEEEIGEQIVPNRAEAALTNKYTGSYRYLGILQIINGLYSIIVGLSCVVFALTASDVGFNLGKSENKFLVVGGGLWCGPVMLAAGILGVKTSNEPTYSKVVASMVLAIFAAVFSAILLVIELCSWFISVPTLRSKYRIEDSEFIEYFVIAGSRSLSGLHGSLIGVSLMETVVAILQSSLSCSSLCYQADVSTVSGDAATREDLNRRSSIAVSEKIVDDQMEDHDSTSSNSH